MEKHDVVIVGAGPAGLQAAKILAENGKDVLILEKVSQDRIGDKICAGALSAKVVKVINPPTSIYDINGDGYDLIMHLPNRDIEVKNERRFQAPMISPNKFVRWQLVEAKKAGASYCIFKSELAEILQLYYKNGEKIYPAGIGGHICAYLNDIGIRIGDTEFDTKVLFSDELVVRFNLLGRVGLFEQFKIYFDERKRYVELTKI
jgi:hypothetical protein